MDGQAGATTSEGGRATGTGQCLSRGPSPQTVCFTTLHREAVSFKVPYSDTGPPGARCHSFFRTVAAGLNQLLANVSQIVAQVKPPSRNVLRGAEEISPGNATLTAH